jgi:hypothetical protein
MTLSIASPERTHHGVHPLEWEVASSFSAIVDDERMRTGSVSGDSVGMPSNSDSEGGLGEFAPNMHTRLCLLILQTLHFLTTGDPNTWEFGPTYRSDMIIAARRHMP